MRKCRLFPRGQLIGRGGQSSESFAVVFVGGCGAVRLADGRVRMVKSLGKEMENWGNDDLLNANIRDGGVSDSAMLQEKNKISTYSKRISRDILVPGDEVVHPGDPPRKTRSKATYAGSNTALHLSITKEDLCLRSQDVVMQGRLCVSRLYPSAY